MCCDPAVLVWVQLLTKARSCLVNATFWEAGDQRASGKEPRGTCWKIRDEKYMPDCSKHWDRTSCCRGCSCCFKKRMGKKSDG